MYAGRLFLVTAGLACGCGGSGSSRRSAPVDAGRSPADAADSLTAEASDDDVASSTPPIRTWTPALDNFVDGDILSIWGSSDDSYFVGTDMALLYERVGGQAWRQTPLDLATVGAGWSSDPSTSYAVGVSAWATKGGGSAGLYKETPRAGTPCCLKRFPPCGAARRRTSTQADLRA